LPRTSAPTSSEPPRPILCSGTSRRGPGRPRLSLRGTQALLDGLVGLGLVRVSAGKYANSEEASAFLVEGKPTYLGAHAKMVVSPFGQVFQRLPEVVKTGVPVASHTADEPENPFWEELVLAIAPLAMPLTHFVAEHTRFASLETPSLLDVGGGSGVYSAVLLQANPRATATQIDWANVNRIARGFVGRFGVGDRFRTVDGDFHTTDFGTGAHDLAIYSNIAHQEGPSSNLDVFRRLRRALKPGGVLVVSDFVLEDDRTGVAWTGLFHSVMLAQTKEGAVWRRADYRAWLTEAGFSAIAFQATPMPSTLIYAR
jgi:SAM-dependent methyltransferase